MQIKKGSSRIVLIFGKFVIKIPNFSYSYENFLHGILANIQENKFSGVHNVFTRILFYCPMGLFVIMKKANPIDDLSAKELEKILNKKYKKDDYFDFIMSDFKVDNFGYINGEIVKIDYGN